MSETIEHATPIIAGSPVSDDEFNDEPEKNRNQYRKIKSQHDRSFNFTSSVADIGSSLDEADLEISTKN